MGERKATGPELVAAIREMQDGLMLRIEMYAVMAADRKAKYDEYIRAGFTDAQAMQLISVEIMRK